MFKGKGLLIVSLITVFLVLASATIACAPKKAKPSPPTPSPPAPAAFQLANLGITPAEVKPGEKVTVTVQITNSGGSQGNYTAELKVNDVVAATQTVTVAAMARQTVTLTLSKDAPGTYKVSLGGLTGQFVVTKPPAPVVRTVTWTDDTATRLLVTAIALSGSTARFMPGNKIVLEYYGGIQLKLNLPIDVADGKFYFTADVPEWVYNELRAIHGYTKYEKATGRLFLTALPPFFDPRKEIAPDVDKLPFIESIITKEGSAIITYRWP